LPKTLLASTPAVDLLAPPSTAVNDGVWIEGIDGENDVVPATSPLSPDLKLSAEDEPILFK